MASRGLANSLRNNLKKLWSLDHLEIPREKLLFAFKDQDEVNSQWICTSDATIGGFSKAELMVTPDQTAKFRGTLSTEVPQGYARSGYCAIRSKPLDNKAGPLRVRQNIDVSLFEALQIRLRGEGRTYICNIQTDGVQEEDLYQAFIYTKGGPEWETVTLPFSEFLLTYQGYVQNEQMMLNRARIRTIGLLLADRLDGPFSLELQSISAVNGGIRR